MNGTGTWRRAGFTRELVFRLQSECGFWSPRLLSECYHLDLFPSVLRDLTVLCSRSNAEIDELFERKIMPWRFHKTETATQRILSAEAHLEAET